MRLSTNFKILCGVLLATLAVPLTLTIPSARAEDAPDELPADAPPADTPPDTPAGDAPARDTPPAQQPNDNAGQATPPGGPNSRSRSGRTRGPDRTAWRREQVEGRLRDLMSGMGFPDSIMQTAIIGYIEDEEKAMSPVRAAGRDLLTAMRDPKTSAERLGVLLNNLHIVMEADKLRRKEAQVILDDKVDYSHSPRLEAMLTLLGVLGDGPAFVPLRDLSSNTGNPAKGGGQNGAPSPAPMVPVTPNTSAVSVNTQTLNAAPPQNPPATTPDNDPGKEDK